MLRFRRTVWMLVQFWHMGATPKQLLLEGKKLMRDDEHFEEWWRCLNNLD